MGRKPETALQQKIRQALEVFIGGKWVKVHGGMYQEAGISDLVGCAFGFYFALEVKTVEDRRGASELQKQFILDIRRQGGCGFVTMSPGAAVRRVKKWLLEQAPVSDEYREYIRETLEHKALCEAESRRQPGVRKKIIRTLYAAEDGEDNYGVKGYRRAVATPRDPSSLGRRTKKRSRGVGEAD